MKGILKNTTAGWFVWYNVMRDEITSGYDSLPLHPSIKVDYSFRENKEVEFEMVNYDGNTKISEGWVGYAKLIKPEYQSDEKTWDEIFTEIEDSLHSPIPVRVKNWLKNKFKSPVKK